MFEQYERHDGSGWHVAHQQPLLGPDEVDIPWDPAEELAHLLQEARQPRPAETFDHYGFDETGETGAAVGAVTEPAPGVFERPVPPTRTGHRRTPAKTSVVTLFGTGSFFTALLVAVIAAVVSIFSGLAICEALRHSAGPRTADDVVNWWPLLIYGPWVTASLSILRAALHQRRAVHSWSIVLLFSTLATLLCVAQAPSTLAAQAAATLPPIAALACLQQLVRQITLTRPPRQAVPRHRGRTFSLLRPPTVVSSPDSAIPDYPVMDQRAARAATPPRFRYGS
ncbi:MULTISPECIES: hypothetical protein [unclassified Streptomyces]|uniref:hypothetical protein n=1 Tax=unclassified Streptomyces TaxID=2593676 RepID=UPI002E35D2B2|nr:MULTISPECIES: hypothetical protein [unclassified Streptomyces]